MSQPAWPRQAGVSLVEALVALAVMAFGILGVVGVQATLRGNADLSKQRGEAVRIAQEAIESWRAFTVLEATDGQWAYADIVPAEDPVAVVGFSADNTNTTYWLTRFVTPLPVGRAKTLAVAVSWTDRAGQNQTVRLNTTVAGVAPELAGSLSLSGDATPMRRPFGRNLRIPVDAVPQIDGTSRFRPPGPSDVTWVFNNVSGEITSICTPIEGCTPSNAFLLSGYVRFATGTPPTPALGETPPGQAFELDVRVNLTNPAATTVECFKEPIDDDGTTYVSYFCAVPVPVPPAVQSWSGQSVLSFAGISTSPADPSDSLFKVCRYTPAATDTPPNIDHPLHYSGVTGPLINQNFLVISAGNGSPPAYTCPGDDTATPINTNTRAHQPPG